MRPTRRLDWEEILAWLEMGYHVGDVAWMFGFNRSYLSQKAKRELSPEQRDRWKATQVTSCGTRSGYVRHTRRGESVCEPCRIAQQQYSKERWQSVRKKRDSHGTGKEGQDPGPN